VICNDGDARLADGSVPSEGRVEICSNNAWLVVCDDPANSRRANRDRLICRQLGYGNVLHKLLGLSLGSASYLPQYWNCAGNESNLLECEFRDIDQSQCNVAGVACENVIGKTQHLLNLQLLLFIYSSTHRWMQYLPFLPQF